MLQFKHAVDTRKAFFLPGEVQNPTQVKCETCHERTALTHL